MRTLPTMDDPDHRKYRNVTRRWFQPGSLQTLEPKRAPIARAIIVESDHVGLPLTSRTGFSQDRRPGIVRS
jgi:cytochrome P450